MRLHRDKVIHLSHLVVDALDDEALVTWHVDKNILRKEIADVILEELELEDRIEQEVRQTLRSYKRKIVEGSREWDVMYQKIFEERMKKRGRIG